MRKAHLCIVILVNVGSAFAANAHAQPATHPTTNALRASGTVIAAGIRKSDFTALEKGLTDEIRSGSAMASSQIANLESRITKLDQSNRDISDAINELRNKSVWGPVLVSALAVIVSAIAVILGTITQNRTIAMARRNTLTTANTARLKDWIEGLQKTLAEFMNVSYNLGFFYGIAMRKNTPWPGDEHWDLVQNEDMLHSNLQLRLDPAKESHNALLKQLAELRDYANRLEINEKRAAVIAAARHVFECEWAENTIE